MKKLFLILMVVVGVFFVANVSADTLFYARATGAEETPQPVDTDASGLIVCSLNTTQDKLTCIADVAGITPTASHIHNAPVGVSGGVVFGIGSDYTNPIVAVWNIPAAMVTELMNGNLYYNVHSAAYGGGEIRGQLGPASTK